MKKNFHIILIVLSFFIYSSEDAAAQLLFVEDFDYPAGDSIGAHGWVWNTGTTNTILVVSPGLVYTGYPSSGIGNAVKLRNNGNDAYKSFSPDSVGNIYSSFMVRIDSALATGDYFFAMLPSTSTTNYTTRIYVKDSTGGISFGISKSSATGGPIVFSPPAYSLNNTYLIVGKYKFNTGTTTDDELSLFVFVSPNLPLTEPSTPTVGPVTGTIADAPNLGRVALRQGSATLAPTLVLDGIRVTKSWSNLVPVISTGKIVQKFYLGQNFPNPFNPFSTISFGIPEDAFVTLTVFDALGREVAGLISDNMNAGEYNVNFDAQALSSGVYFYRLTAVRMFTGAVSSETRSMIIIK